MHAQPTAVADPVADGAHGRPRFEVADIFRLYGDAYRQTHVLTPTQLRVMRDIERCRTAALGGHIEQCDTCGGERPAYNSCGNRHCPKCQSLAKARWLEARQAEVLPAPYFHSVFTLPHEINPTAFANKKPIYNLLFRSVAATLKRFAADPKHGLGGKLGFTAMLHTWDQQLRGHLHLHCIIPGGVLADDESRWISAKPDFLFDIHEVSADFRDAFIDGLERLVAEGKITLCNDAGEVEGADFLDRLVDTLRSKDWVVFIKAAFGKPEEVLGYLARYTHRVAISNHRIVDVGDGDGDGRVTFQYRDRRADNEIREAVVTAEQFIGRFLLHVLPSGFMRVRHFGFLASRAKGAQLSRCRELLGLPAELPKPAPVAADELMLRLTGIDVTKCPICGRGTMRVVRGVPRAALDTAVVDVAACAADPP